jgi:hypothetical protein
MTTRPYAMYWNKLYVVNSCFMPGKVVMIVPCVVLKRLIVGPQFFLGTYVIPILSSAIFIVGRCTLGHTSYYILHAKHQSISIHSFECYELT